MTLLSMQDSNMSSSKKTPVCEHCDSGDPAVSRCTNCCVFMCEFCVTAHKRINAFKGHKILSLEEVKRVGSKALVKPAFCKKHGGELVKLFCQTCQKTICRDCTIVDHREHKYDFVADIAEKERRSVRAILEKCSTKEKAVQKGLKAVQNMKSRVLTKVSEVNKQVDSFIDEQVKVLEEHRAHLKHEATTQGQVKVKLLDSQADDLSSLLAQLRSGIDFTGQAIVDGDDVKLLSLKTQLVQRLSRLISSQDQLKPCQNDYMKLQVKRSIRDEGELAQMIYKQCDPQRCTISMGGRQEGVIYPTTMNENVYFTVIIKDESGCRVTEGGHKVSIQIQLRDNLRRVHRDESYWEESAPRNQLANTWKALAVQDNGDGSYTFSYCPMLPGFCSLSVNVEGKPIHGSPFNWQVNQAVYNEDVEYKEYQW